MTVAKSPDRFHFLLISSDQGEITWVCCFCYISHTLTSGSVGKNLTEVIRLQPFLKSFWGLSEMHSFGFWVVGQITCIYIFYVKENHFSFFIYSGDQSLVNFFNFFYKFSMFLFTKKFEFFFSLQIKISV